jgi:hypothetical protein
MVSLMVLSPVQDIPIPELGADINFCLQLRLEKCGVEIVS